MTRAKRDRVNKRGRGKGEKGKEVERTWGVAGRENAYLGKARIHGARRIMRWIFEFILVHVTMPGTSGVYTRIPRQRATCIQPAGGRGTPGASANYVAFRVVYAGGAREKRRNFRCLHRLAEARERGLTDGNERKRKGRESAYAREGGAGRNSGGTFACLRRFRAVSGNKRQTRTTEKVSVARFARVHLTKKSNIYFPTGTRARATKRTLAFLFATSRCTGWSWWDGCQKIPARSPIAQGW